MIATRAGATGRETRYRAGLGRLCLDFAATAASPASGSGEQLRVPLDVRAWLLAADLPATRLVTTSADLHRMLVLRDAVAVVLARALNEDTMSAGRLTLGPALDTVNEAAAIAPPRPRLQVGPTGDLVVNWEQPSDLAPFLSAIGRDLLTLASDEQCRGRLYRCAAGDCRRVFLAKPIGRTRRWCSSQGCGARTRVAAYRARHAGETPYPREAP